MRKPVSSETSMGAGAGVVTAALTPTVSKQKKFHGNQYTLASAVTRVVLLDESIVHAAKRSGEIAPYRTEAVVRALARMGAEKLDLQGRSLRSFVSNELRRVA